MQRTLAFVLMVLLSATPTLAVAQEVSEQETVLETAIEAVATSTEVLVQSEAPSPVLTQEVEELSGTYVEGEVIVKYKESTIDLDDHSDQRAADTVIESLSMETVGVIEGMNMAVVETPEDTTIAEAIATLEANPAVEYAEPNYTRSIETLASTSVELANSWALQNTGQTVNGVTGTLGADINALGA